jgi:hypothetical protein
VTSILTFPQSESNPNSRNVSKNGGTTSASIMSSSSPSAAKATGKATSSPALTVSESAGNASKRLSHIAPSNTESMPIIMPKRTSPEIIELGQQSLCQPLLWNPSTTSTMVFQCFFASKSGYVKELIANNLTTSLNGPVPLPCALYDSGSPFLEDVIPQQSSPLKTYASFTLLETGQAGSSYDLYTRAKYLNTSSGPFKIYQDFDTKIRAGWYAIAWLLSGQEFLGNQTLGMINPQTAYVTAIQQSLDVINFPSTYTLSPSSNAPVYIWQRHLLY